MPTKKLTSTSPKSEPAKTKSVAAEKTTKTTPTRKPTSMADLLGMKPLVPPKKGAIVQAKIVDLTKKGILFDIGWKSYAVLGNIEAHELGSYLPYLNAGDTVPVKIVVEEAKDGFPVVSMRSFFEDGKWNILIEKHKDEKEIEVVCGEYGKGGVFIEFMGIRGVIPKIQLTEEYLRDPEQLIGKKIKVKVLEVDRDKNRLVVSQKASVLGISYKDIKKKFDEVEIGKIYKAKVIGFSDFGVFCEVNKIEGLIHISEISWQKVSNPRKFLNVGDDIDVMVVEKNEDNLKLNLSIKRLEQDPWESIEERYPKDKEVKGEIVRKEKYGYIVRLEPGIEGLIHISKVTGHESIEIGKPITVYIEKIDVRQRRISLVFALVDKPVVYR
ncbi:MAG TPA: S1 RNA-binding domain-containing protein [Acidimicrobiia bacterium]|nr:S1 RNA-binding domain-containing protein [Acidimicrobiia bacterium]